MENFSNYLPVNRKLFAHALWNEERSFSKCEAWLWLMAQARFEHTPGTMVIGQKLVRWNRGEVVASLRYLAQAWGWSTGKVALFITMLEEENMIKRRTAGKTLQTIITLCNYATYNPGKIKNEQQLNSSYTVTEHVMNSVNTSAEQLLNKSNKENKENNVNKENNGNVVSPTPTHFFTEIEIQDFTNFQQWVVNNAPRVAQMRQPFTITQYTKLAREHNHDGERVLQLLREMDNWLPLLTKKVSAYRTLINWKMKQY